MIDKIATVCKAHGNVQIMRLTPDRILPHPENRGKRMLVAAELHIKAETIMVAGPKMHLIGRSIVFEFPTVRDQ